MDAYLVAWKSQQYRKPLLLRGARQIGKTYTVRQLAKTFEHFVEINFERDPRALTIFAAQKNLDPKRIIEEISAFTGKKITPGSTLLFFDEIQVCPRALTALRYFYEEMSELHIVGAGSLLNFAIEQVGISVGRFDSLYMYPVSILEFFAAVGQTTTIEQLLEKPEIVYSTGVHEQLLGLVGRYMAVGGMPEVITKWIETGDINQCLIAQQAIIDTYRQDFGKYARKNQIDYVATIFNAIPYQLGGKFKYNIIEGDYRKRELAPALDLLTTAGVVHRIFHTGAHGVPLGAEADLATYKAILMDSALNQKVLGLHVGAWIVDPIHEFVNRGALVEAVVGQEILAYADPRQKAQLYYWRRMEKNSTAEVDYVLQKQEHIIPIEVKSGHGTTLKSMHMFLDLHKQSPYGVRFSMQNYSVYEKVRSVPLYAIAQVVVNDAHMVLKALT